MKSSTIRRSNLSKEKMAVLEALSKYRDDSHDITPNVYVRPSKEKEIDVLWQSFKLNQKSEKSPSVFLATGFIAGIIASAILVGLYFVSTHAFANRIPKQPKPKVEAVDFVPSDTTAQTVESSNETYTVQSGDTMESIMIRFYGGYSEEKLQLIKEANEMADVNKLSIGQKLIIPVKKD